MMTKEMALTEFREKFMKFNRVCIARNCAKKFADRGTQGNVRCVNGVMVAQSFADRYCDSCNAKRPWLPIIEEVR